MSPPGSLWAESMHLACSVLNNTTTIANPGNKSPRAIMHKTAAPAWPHHFLKPAHYRLNELNKSFTKRGSCFYVRSNHDHPRGFLCIVTGRNKMIVTRHITSQAPTKGKVSLPPLLVGATEWRRYHLHLSSSSPLASPFAGKGVPCELR